MPKTIAGKIYGKFIAECWYVEDIGRAGIVAIVIVPTSPNDSRIFNDRYAISKPVIDRSITSDEFFDFTPVIRSTLITSKDIGRA